MDDVSKSGATNRPHPQYERTRLREKVDKSLYQKHLYPPDSSDKEENRYPRAHCGFTAEYRRWMRSTPSSSGGIWWREVGDLFGQLSEPISLYLLQMGGRRNPLFTMG